MSFQVPQILFSIIVITGLSLFDPPVFSEPVDPTGFRHITFKGLPETVYARQADVLKISVRKSSSFLFQSFEYPKNVKSVSCIWRMTHPGNPSARSAESYKAKTADDFPLRIGLMVAGKAPVVPFFASAWIKAVASFSKHPSDRLIYLTAGSPFTGGAVWPSPHSGSIEHIAFTEATRADGWRHSEHVMASPLQIVGLWIMSDGDDTAAEFDVEVKDLTIQFL